MTRFRLRHPHGYRAAKCRAVVTVLLAAAGLGSLFAHSPSSAGAAGCTNESIRASQGTAALELPDCRAYELVSPGATPLVSSAGDVSFGVKAADDGNALAYLSYYPFALAPSSGWLFRARRGHAGWSLEAMSPQLLPGAATKVICEATELNYSQDLSASVLRIGRELEQEYPEDSFCGQPQEEIVPGEPRGFANLLRREGPDAPYELVNVTPPPASPANAQFQDASDDLNRVYFGEEAALTPDAPSGYNLYLWAGGAVGLVTFLPDGTAVRGDLAGATRHRTGPKAGDLEGGTGIGVAPFTNAVSADGERAFFYAEGNLYLRENAGQQATSGGACSDLESDRACTIQVDISRGIDASGAGVFQYASADGGRVFFSSERRLTFPSSAAPEQPALYEYDVEADTIADRTLGGAEAAGFRGFSGAAEDGSRLYFVADGALTGGQENGQGAVAQAGQPNLYLLEEGAVTFIATLDPKSDRSAWGYELQAQPGAAPAPDGAAALSTRTSPNGRHFAFNSALGLTGGPAGAEQIFTYDAMSGELKCASCLPGGGAPPGSSALPAPITTTESQAPGYLPRGLTDAGQLFFTTVQPLVAEDTNEVADVYEHGQGELRLLSDGSGDGPAFFFDASVGGRDVFFATSDPLVGADTDNGLTLYNARVDGGFAEPAPSGPPCDAAGACRPVTPTPPVPSLLPTPGFIGAGNVTPPKRCEQGRVKRQGRCVRVRHRKHSNHLRHQRQRDGKRGASR